MALSSILLYNLYLFAAGDHFADFDLTQVQKSRSHTHSTGYRMKGNPYEAASAGRGGRV